MIRRIGYGDDPYANKNTKASISVGGSVRGTLDMPEDVDWYSVQLTSGRTYRFVAEGFQTRVGTLSDPLLRGVYDNTGALLHEHTDGAWGANSVMTYTATRTGKHFVAVANGSGLTDQSVTAAEQARQQRNTQATLDPGAGTFLLSVADVTNAAADDHPADATTSGTIAIGAGVMGEVETAQDADWYAVTLEAGTRYKFTANGSGTGSVSGAQVAGVFDSDSTSMGIQHIDFEGLLHTDFNASQARTSTADVVTFTPDLSGTYYVAVGTATGSTSTGNYTLLAEVLAVDSWGHSTTDEHPEDTTTTATVAVGSSVTGIVNTAFEQDWIAVTLNAGVEYQIDLTGRTSGNGSLADPRIAGLFDASGDYIAGTINSDIDETTTESHITFTPSVTGTYYIAVSADDNSTGSYQLTVTVATTP